MPSNRRIIILTGAELRHTFFRKWLALDGGITVLKAYCEGTEKSIGAVVQLEAENALRMRHLKAREQSEEDFFRLFVETSPDQSRTTALHKGEVNDDRVVREVIELKPDLIIAYGCSIIRDPLLSKFPKRIVNIHLGLSPYYRGSGTNYWPLVNKEPEYVGATLMFMDAGVDTGEIIHQIRARMAPGDTAVQIGNRLITDTARTCVQLIKRFDQIECMPQPAATAGHRYYRKKDYTEASVTKLYSNFAAGMIDEYLEQQENRCAAAPIVSHPQLVS